MDDGPSRTSRESEEAVGVWEKPGLSAQQVRSEMEAE